MGSVPSASSEPPFYFDTNLSGLHAFSDTVIPTDRSKAPAFVKDHLNWMPKATVTQRLAFRADGGRTRRADCVICRQGTGINKGFCLYRKRIFN